jgi:SAM-dependent methyltransferase
MHNESHDVMKYFVEKHLKAEDKLDILDVGSYDANGSYKDLFMNKNWGYTGLDMVAGPNVDIISNGPYDFGLEKQYDVVISGNCLEHVEAPWLWIKEVEKVIKPNGLLCIVVPFNVEEHRYPVDCWRILPDGFKYLLCQHSSFEMIETRVTNPPKTLLFFDRRPNLMFIHKLLPVRIGKLFYKPPAFVDTYAIARKVVNEVL